MSSALTEPPDLRTTPISPTGTPPVWGAGVNPLWRGAGALLIACAVGLILALVAGVIGIRAVPAVLRTAAVAIGFFALCGYVPTRLLIGGELREHSALWVLPIGAVLSSLVLAVLGVLHVPLNVSLIAVLALALPATAWTARRRPPASIRVEPPARRQSPVAIALVLPLLLAGMVGLISLIPIFRAGYATVPGQNGDAILAVGTATLLQHAPPTATRLDLPINHVPLQWRSKYPIYYALAGISTLAGQDPIQTFPTLSALVLAMTALGFFLFARLLLRAPPWAALLILFLVPLDRIAVYVTIHPYYNELWGQFTLPFTLVAGWRYLSSPSRSSAALFALFLVLGLLAYPLMIPFPATFLIVYAGLLYRRKRSAGQSPEWISGLRLPHVRRSGLMWVAAGLISVPVVLVLGRGFLEKVTEAAAVIGPGTSLAGWHSAALPYLPLPWFFGTPDTGWSGVVLVGLGLLAWRAFSRIPPEARRPLGGMVVVAGLIGIYFRVRDGGQLFFFKDLAFLGPYVLMLGLFELAELARTADRRRWIAGVGGLALALVLVPAGAAQEIDTTFEQANLSVLGLRNWDQKLPHGTSVRIDVPATGYQLWVTYMFKDHPLSALHPLGDFFPHPPVGRKADYVIAEYDQQRPADAAGQPLFRNAQFTLWQMRRDVPAPDVSSRRLIDNISSVSLG